MEKVFPIEKLSVKEKLALMELLWEDLSNNPESIPSPSWHEEVLKEREKRVNEGKAKFYNLSEVKERIKNSIK